MKKTIAILCLCICLQSAYSSTLLVEQSELFPGKKHHDATKHIINIINNLHYRKKPLDDDLSSSIFDTYMNSLDINRSFFLKEDVKKLSDKYYYLLDDNLKVPDLEPAFDIFNIYRTRVKQRIDYALTELEKDFDFETDENYMFDRQKLDWADSVSALNDIWRKRIKNDILSLTLAGKKEANIKDMLKKRYEKIYTNTFQLESNDIFQIFINSYTTAIEPHTSYFSPRTSENFDISMRLSLEGIGAVLRSEHDYTMIHEIIPGGPADLSKKLHSKDKIIGVGQGNDREIVDVIGWRLDDVVELIRGPKGSVLRLEIIPSKIGNEDLTETITLTRDKVKLEGSAAKSKIIELPGINSKIGVIDIPTFYIDFAAQAQRNRDFKSTSRDIRKLIAELNKGGIAGIIVDLRGNGGGSLSEALAVTGLFIQQGPIVQTKNAAGRIDIHSDPDPSTFYTGPLAVLVDRHSASASEIFAGAIQDYQRGIIIGEPTYGKGTVQTIIDINNLAKNSKDDLGKLKTTIQQFFRVSGGSNQNKGVVPDIVFPTATNIHAYGERSLDNALPWDEIKPAKYLKVSAPIRYYDQVRVSHEQRVNSSGAFKLLIKQLEIIRKNRDKKTISLNYDKRKAEREQIMNTKHELENELRITQGLVPLEKQTDTLSDNNGETSENNENKEDKLYDILLQETAHILNDLIILANVGTTTLQTQKINLDTKQHNDEVLSIQ